MLVLRYIEEHNYDFLALNDADVKDTSSPATKSLLDGIRALHDKYAHYEVCFYSLQIPLS